MICLLLAIFSAFGYFHMKALFIDFFCGLVKGLFGYGFWLVPPALLLGSYILAFHRGRPVALRLTCALSLPGVFACTVHGLLNPVLPWDATLLKTLWAGGEAMRSGGALSGTVAQAFVQVFSSIGATVVFVLAFLLLALGAFNRTIVDVADWIFNRPEYEPQEIPERPRRQAPAPAARVETKTARGRSADIDIPVEDGPLVGKEPQPTPAPEKRKGSFFNRISRVPAPDQLLRGTAKASPAQPEETVTPEPEPVKTKPEPAADPIFTTPPPPVQPDPIFAPEAEVAEHVKEISFAPEPAPVVPPARAPMAMPEIVREPAVPKMTQQESQQAAQEVSAHIQQGLSQQTPPYQYPPLELLQEGKGELGGEALGELSANRQRLSDTIHSFGIDANIVNVVRGPSVTRYELELDQGVRLNKLTNLADDIALALGATGVRIAPIPDKISVVGIEVPNKVV